MDKLARLKCEKVCEKSIFCRIKLIPDALLDLFLRNQSSETKSGYHFTLVKAVN